MLAKAEVHCWVFVKIDRELAVSTMVFLLMEEKENDFS